MAYFLPIPLIMPLAVRLRPVESQVHSAVRPGGYFTFFTVPSRLYAQPWLAGVPKCWAGPALVCWLDVTRPRAS